jgi:hypothetical protein
MEKSMKNILMILPTIILCFQITGCDSNFVEKDPKGSGGLLVESDLLNISTKNDTINEKIEKIDEITKRIQKITKLIRKATDKMDENGNHYSLIDFIIDANENLKGSIPVKEANSHYLKTNSIDLKISQIPEKCRKLETKIEASPDENNPDVGRITYSVKNCATDGDFVSILNATWYENSIFIDTDNQSLQKILGDTAIQTAANSLKCEAKNEDSRNISKIQCNDIEVKLSSTENAIVSMLYDRTAQIRFAINSKIVEGNNTKARLIINIDKRGSIKADLQKVSSSQAKL